MSELKVRAMTLADVGATVSLYRTVAAVPGSGLARQSDEISQDYVEGFLTRATSSGLSLGAFVAGKLVGEIHATRLGPRQFDHVLTDLTVAVHPDAQGGGVGTRLFGALFKAATRLAGPVTRIELVARSGNGAALRLYERLGFRPEGRFQARVALADGRVEDDIPMARILSVHGSA